MTPPYVLSHFRIWSCGPFSGPAIFCNYAWRPFQKLKVHSCADVICSQLAYEYFPFFLNILGTCITRFDS